ncbi:hypothetical protein [Actinomycetospora corticicola]|uniref:Uncharacterized protein n=1 Tax=Actinomycetospora corticicola TaxID=663602 RepID=A0A7Y9DXC6_9PSEU|nr:hypothetical protein [Actinomycetospora corticicola]NYD37263.1 hypothetical protein [Actinomycetospora corticicola]
MDELVFDETRSVIVGSMLRVFAADGRATAEVERLLVHVARTASTQDLVDVAYDLAAQVLSPAAWSALCEEPWLAAELDAAAEAPAPVEVRLVVTGATSQQVRRLLDRPAEVLGEALGLPGDAEPDAPEFRPQSADDAEMDPGEFDKPEVVPRRPGTGDSDEVRGRRLSRASSVRTRRRGGPARRAARGPGCSPSGSRPSAARPRRSCGPRDASGPAAPGPADAGDRVSRGPADGPTRPARCRRRPGTAIGPPGAARRGSPGAARRGREGADDRRSRFARGPGPTGSRSRDGPDVGFAHRGGARTVTM